MVTPKDDLRRCEENANRARGSSLLRYWRDILGTGDAEDSWECVECGNCELLTPQRHSTHPGLELHVFLGWRTWVALTLATIPLQDGRRCRRTGGGRDGVLSQRTTNQNQKTGLLFLEMECRSRSAIAHHLRRSSDNMGLRDGLRDFLSLPRKDRRARSEARSEAGPIAGPGGVDLVVQRPTESSPDLRIAPPTLSTPSPSTSRNQESNGMPTILFRLIRIITSPQNRPPRRPQSSPLCFQKRTKQTPEILR
jgi:hypothetical protein